MDTEQLKILDDAPLVGPAATYEEMGDADDTAVAEVIDDRMRDYGLGVAGARGLPDMRRIIDWLRGCKLVADHGVHPVQVDWLGFHVPPGGSAQLTLARRDERSGKATLKFMGLGYGSGRAVSLAAEQDFGSRDACFALGAKLSVRLRTYRNDDREQLRVDVERCDGAYLVSHDACGLCFRAPATGPQPRLPGREWDLAGDPHGLTETIKYEVAETSDIELGLDVPVPGVGSLNAGVTMSRAVTSSCVVTYGFPGRARFQSYTRILPGIDLPFWERS